MNLVLDAADLARVRAHGEETFPHECCGFLLGTESDGERRVHAILPAENEREEPNRNNRFLITPDAYRRAEKEARGRGLDVVGFYHSHPDSPARPSEYDREHAWPWYSYVIVSVRGRKAEEATAWRLADDRSAFEPEELAVRSPVGK